MGYGSSGMKNGQMKKNVKFIDGKKSGKEDNMEKRRKDQI